MAYMPPRFCFGPQPGHRCPSVLHSPIPSRATHASRRGLRPHSSSGGDADFPVSKGWRIPQGAQQPAERRQAHSPLGGGRVAEAGDAADPNGPRPFSCGRGAGPPSDLRGAGFPRPGRRAANVNPSALYERRESPVPRANAASPWTPAYRGRAILPGPDGRTEKATGHAPERWGSGRRAAGPSFGTHVPNIMPTETCYPHRLTFHSRPHATEVDSERCWYVYACRLTHINCVVWNSELMADAYVYAHCFHRHSVPETSCTNAIQQVYQN